MHGEIVDLLERYLEERSPESFMRLREAVAASPDYVPYGESPESVLSTVKEDDYEKAKTALLAIVGGGFLNPGIHNLLAFVHHKLGDEVGANYEFELGMRCLEGILSTGTGEEAHPYLVLHTADEYDVLDHLEKKSLTRQLVRTPQRQAYDRHECEDGVVLWFDVTTPYALMAASLDRKT